MEIAPTFDFLEKMEEEKCRLLVDAVRNKRIFSPKKREREQVKSLSLENWKRRERKKRGERERAGNRKIEKMRVRA